MPPAKDTAVTRVDHVSIVVPNVISLLATATGTSSGPLVSAVAVAGMPLRYR